MEKFCKFLRASRKSFNFRWKYIPLVYIGWGSTWAFFSLSVSFSLFILISLIFKSAKKSMHYIFCHLLMRDNHWFWFPLLNLILFSFDDLAWRWNLHWDNFSLEQRIKLKKNVFFLNLLRIRNFFKGINEEKKAFLS